MVRGYLKAEFCPRCGDVILRERKDASGYTCESCRTDFVVTIEATYSRPDEGELPLSLFCPACGEKHLFRTGEGNRVACSICKMDMTVEFRTRTGMTPDKLTEWVDRHTGELMKTAGQADHYGFETDQDARSAIRKVVREILETGDRIFREDPNFHFFKIVNEMFPDLSREDRLRVLVFGQVMAGNETLIRERHGG